MGYPSDYRYTKEHEWVRVEGDVATVGITDYAQHELGDVVYAEMPKPGTKLNAGQSFGTVESVKAVSDSLRARLRHHHRSECDARRRARNNQ